MNNPDKHMVFGHGLNIFSGKEGAGKSLLVAAILSLYKIVRPEIAGASSVTFINHNREMRLRSMMVTIFLGEAAAASSCLTTLSIIEQIGKLSVKRSKDTKELEAAVKQYREIVVAIDQRYKQQLTKKTVRTLVNNMGIPELHDDFAGSLPYGIDSMTHLVALLHKLIIIILKAADLRYVIMRTEPEEHALDKPNDLKIGFTHMRYDSIDVRISAYDGEISTDLADHTHLVYIASWVYPVVMMSLNPDFSFITRLNQGGSLEKGMSSGFISGMAMVNSTLANEGGICIAEVRDDFGEAIGKIRGGVRTFFSVVKTGNITLDPNEFRERSFPHDKFVTGQLFSKVGNALTKANEIVDKLKYGTGTASFENDDEGDIPTPSFNPLEKEPGT